MKPPPETKWRTAKWQHTLKRIKFNNKRKSLLMRLVKYAKRNSSTQTRSNLYLEYTLIYNILTSSQQNTN